MAEEDYVQAPKSRLDANTVAASRAMDAQRRAVSSQRQQMAVERMLQRKWKRAVRKEDYGAMQAIGKEMQSIGLSRIGKGGIQSSEENDFEAFRRAEKQREIGNKVGKEMDEMTGKKGEAKAEDVPPAENDAEEIQGAVNKRSTMGAGRGRPVGSGAADSRLPDEKPSEEGVAGPSGKAGALGAPADQTKPKFNPYTRERFVADVMRSESVMGGDEDAIERAAARGSRFGITKEQIQAYVQDEDASKSATAKRKEEIANRPADARKPLGESFTEADRKKISALKSLQESFSGVDERLKSTDEQLAKTREILSQPEPETPIFAKKQKTQNPVLEEKKNTPIEPISQKEADYWNVDPSLVLDRKIWSPDGGFFGDRDKSDPRYLAMSIKREAQEKADSFDFNQSGLRTKEGEIQDKKNWIQDYMIKRSIELGKAYDISGFTKQDPIWHAKYTKELQYRSEMDQRIKNAEEMRQTGSNLVQSLSSN